MPDGAGLEQLRAAAAGCAGCELHGPATQTVFSSGSPLARLAFVGEQPGDAEDRQGAPFVGPAGRLLDHALEQAGIDRADAYVTNAVKHFRFTRTPQRRLHQTPDLAHLTACRPWLVAELAVVDPEVVVCLGATAARTLLGPSFRVTRQRGILYPRTARSDDATLVQSGWMMGTVHPSSVLRADDRDAALAGLVADLGVAAAALVPA
ncbi:MAG: phage polymerase-related protein [Nocardioidaceae bacterium]|nr:phage polymerase-related protein [Nocardioidaceae bacterium]